MKDDKEPLQIILSRTNPTNGSKYVFEIMTLVSEICDLLGSDLDGFGKVEASEFEGPEWIGRSWNVGSSVYRLVSTNVCIQLYIYI